MWRRLPTVPRSEKYQTAKGKASGFSATKRQRLSAPPDRARRARGNLTASRTGKTGRWAPSKSRGPCGVQPHGQAPNATGSVGAVSRRPLEAGGGLHAAARLLQKGGGGIGGHGAVAEEMAAGFRRLAGDGGLFGMDGNPPLSVAIFSPSYAAGHARVRKTCPPPPAPRTDGGDRDGQPARVFDFILQMVLKSFHIPCSILSNGRLQENITGFVRQGGGEGVAIPLEGLQIGGPLQAVFDEKASHLSPRHFGAGGQGGAFAPAEDGEFAGDADISRPPVGQHRPGRTRRKPDGSPAPRF